MASGSPPPASAPDTVESATDSDMVDGEHAADIVTKTRVDAVGPDAATFGGNAPAYYAASANLFSGDHADLTGTGASDHHSRYTDSEAVAAVTPANIGAATLPTTASEVSVSSGDQGTLSSGGTLAVNGTLLGGFFWENGNTRYLANIIVHFNDASTLTVPFNNVSDNSRSKYWASLPALGNVDYIENDPSGSNATSYQIFTA